LKPNLPYSFAPPAIVQNAAKEALEVVEANQYRYILFNYAELKKRRLNITL
jgi:preprotein translocase subunit Sec63